MEDGKAVAGCTLGTGAKLVAQLLEVAPPGVLAPKVNGGTKKDVAFGFNVFPWLVE